MAATFSVQVIFANEGLPAAFEPTAFDNASFQVGVSESDWIDITLDVVDTALKTMRGFQSTEPQDLVAAPSSFSFSLSNSIYNSAGVLGYYSPDSPSVRAGWQINILVRLQITANGTTFTKFVGWLDAITPKAGLYDTQTVDCIAKGWLNQAATGNVNSLAAVANQRGDQLTALLVALVTNPPVATAFAAGIDTYPYAFDDLDPATSTVVDGLDSVTKSGFDRIWERGDGTLVFESRQTRETYMPPSVILQDVPGNVFPLTAFPIARQRAKIYNTFQVTVHPRRTDGSPVVLWTFQTSGSDPSIGPGQSVTLQAPYVDPNQQAQQIGAFNTLISDGMGGATIGTSGALPVADYEFTSGPGGTGTNLSGAFTVSIVYSATSATITYTNGGTQAAYTALLQCRGQGLYNYQAAIGTATVGSSQTAIGRNAAPLDCPYNADPQFATAAATYMAKLYAQSVSALDQGVQLFVHAEDEVTMATLLSLDISSPIAVTETMSGVTQGAYWINGEQLKIDERGNITFTFSLAPNLAGVVWTLGVAGTSNLGLSTTLGF